MLTLYTTPTSTCSQKVRMALAEKNLPYTQRQMALDKAEHLTDWYLALNPNGVVPALDHDGDIIIDSSVITEYLEDTFPDHPLRPRNPVGAAKMRAWRAYIDEVPTPAIRPPSFNAFLVQGFATLTPAEFDAAAARRPLRSHFYRKMGQTGFDQETIAAALADLRQTLDRMDVALANGPWVCGEMFTLADISMVPTIVRMEDLDLAHLWSDLPRVRNWFERIQLRKSFEHAYAPPARHIYHRGGIPPSPHP